MSIKTVWDKDRNLTIHFVTGHVSEVEMYSTVENFYDQQPTSLVLWDMAQAELSHITTNTLLKFIKKAGELGINRRGGRTAVIAPDDLQYGLGRMAEIFSQCETTPFMLRAFRSRQDAMLWLQSDYTGQ